MHISGRRGVRLIDATRMVDVYHQAHGYQHVKQGSGQSWEGPEADRNRAVARQFSDVGHFYPHLYTVRSAGWLLTPYGVLPAWTWTHLYARIHRIIERKRLSGLHRTLQLRSRLRPIAGVVFRPMKAVVRAVRQLRVSKDVRQ
jgi:hypothetical protein